MKIGSLPVVAMEQYQTNKVRTRKAEAPAMGTDSLEFSASSRLFAAALQAAKESPEVRMDKVEAVRAQIAGGTYQTDAAAIAAKMLSGAVGQ